MVTEGGANGDGRENDASLKKKRRKNEKKRKRRWRSKRRGEETERETERETGRRHRPLHCASGAVDEGSERVLMDDHVDDSLLTVIPFTNPPGLRVWDAEYNAWLSPEEDLDVREDLAASAVTRDEVYDDDDVERVLNGEAEPRVGGDGGRFAVVMVGETLEFLTGGRLPATRHKVVLSAGSRGFKHGRRVSVADAEKECSSAQGTANRLSFPFLLRPRIDAILQPGVCGGVEGMSVGGGGITPGTPARSNHKQSPALSGSVLASAFIDNIKKRHSSAVHLAPDVSG